MHLCYMCMRMCVCVGVCADWCVDGSVGGCVDGWVDVCGAPTKLQVCLSMCNLFVIPYSFMFTSDLFYLFFFHVDNVQLKN